MRSRYGETFMMLETEDGLLLVPALEDSKTTAKILLSKCEELAKRSSGHRRERA